MTIEFAPGLILILGAVLVPLLRGVARAAWMLALPVAGFAVLYMLPDGSHMHTTRTGWGSADYHYSVDVMEGDTNPALYALRTRTSACSSSGS